MQEVFNKYGCNVLRFTSVEDLEILMEKFNSIMNIKQLKFNFCKDDTNIFVLITNYYIVKLYSSKQYQKIFSIYSKIKSTNNIEKIYYYYSVSNGLIIHDTYPFFHNKIENINATISELLIPIFNINGDIITTGVAWTRSIFRKLLLDVAKGLKILHDEGIVHGDATPDNVGLRYSDGNFVLFDFGSAEFSNKGINDINRFLKSLLTTYKSFFEIYYNEIINIRNLIKKGMILRMLLI
jgi:serine/threonine protein kinase